MATLNQFDPPGQLGDFDAKGRAAWNEFLNSAFDGNVQDVDQAVGASRSPFYNPCRTATIEPVATKVIRWKGFPLLIASKHPGDDPAAWAEADRLLAQGERPQDEYLEWHVEKKGNKIVRVTFTCEGPEYWEALAEGYPRGYTGPRTVGATGDKQKLLALYRQHIDPTVQLEDLLDPEGHYAPLNKWNTTHGAMHLNQRNNTLTAEVTIAAQATILRQRDGQVLNDPDVLIRCAQFGAPGRASDPHIGAEVNALARQGFAITLQNPIGLYIDSLDTTGWTTPNGKAASQFWKIVRGTPTMGVRAVFEVPAGEGYAVSDIKIGGRNIEFGGQIAQQITMKLTGIACQKGTKLNPALGCVGASVGVVHAALPARRRWTP